MKNIKFNLSGIDYRIQVTKKETGSNYNLFAHLFKGEDKKSPLAGTSFNDNTTKEEFLEWGKGVIGKSGADCEYLNTLQSNLLHAKEFNPSKVGYYEELIFEWLINAPGSRNAKKVIDCLSNISLFTLSSKLNYCTESGVEYYIGQSSDKAVILAFIHDESIYFIDKNELREMALTAKVKGINHVTLYTNYGLELHSKYETPFTVGMNVIEKIALN